MKFKQVIDENEKNLICSSILRSLPNWFGIESAIVDYTEAVRNMNMWSCEIDNQTVGFISIEMHNTHSAEIHVMGVLENFHNQQIGKSLIEIAIQNLKKNTFNIYKSKRSLKNILTCITQKLETSTEKWASFLFRNSLCFGVKLTLACKCF